MTINSSKTQMILQDSSQDQVPLSHNRFKGRVTRAVKEVKEARVNSNQIRNKDTFSLTKMMSLVTHRVCIYQCSTTIAVIAKEETLNTMMEMKWTTIRGMGPNIAIQATSAPQRIQMMDQTVIMEL